MSDVNGAYETLLVSEAAEHVLLVTINRPRAANSLNFRAARELAGVFSGLQADPPRFRCAVITGAGDRVLCAGADLKEREALGPDEAERQYGAIAGALRAVLASPVPVIAAVNGAAYAGGLELALSCDFAYASADARFALTEVSIGIMPGGGGTQLLPRVIGERRATELILTAQPFSAADAHAWGVVNKVCRREETVNEAVEAACRVARNAPLSVRQARKAIRLGLQMDLGSGLQFESEAYHRLLSSEDRREGLAAFKEKRPPRFVGR